MNKQQLTGKIVTDYLEKFPGYPALTLAKKIYAENIEVYTDVEHVRKMILYYIGQNGKKNRADIKINKFVRDARDTNPFSLPESDMEVWQPYHIPVENNKILIFSDSHFPYQDNTTLTSMIDHAKGRIINTIVLNGDTIDFYQLSRFMKDPRKRSMNDEIWAVVEFINILEKEFPGADIIFKEGNHDSRLEKYLYVKAPELLNMREYRLEYILKERGANIKAIVPEKQIMYAGRLPILHGSELQGGAASPVNPARGLFMKTLSSAMVSHHHRSSSHSETDVNEKLMSTWSLGCTCGLHPEYAPINKWNSGFAYIETEGQDFSVDNYKIYKGKVYKD